MLFQNVKTHSLFKLIVIIFLTWIWPCREFRMISSSFWPIWDLAAASLVRAELVVPGTVRGTCGQNSDLSAILICPV